MLRVVLANGHTVRVFRTMATAEREIEPRDAVGGTLRAWDETGRRLRIDVGDGVCLDAARISLSPEGGTAADALALQALLRDHLEASGVARRSDASLADLLAVAIARDGYAG